MYRSMTPLMYRNMTPLLLPPTTPNGKAKESFELLHSLLEVEKEVVMSHHHSVNTDTLHHLLRNIHNRMDLRNMHHRLIRAVNHTDMLLLHMDTFHHLRLILLLCMDTLPHHHRRKVRHRMDIHLYHLKKEVYQVHMDMLLRSRTQVDMIRVDMAWVDIIRRVDILPRLKDLPTRLI